jgi:Na+/melibiose symporter-like transporter
MVSAVAMTSMIWQSSRIISPAVAGVVIAAAGTATVFFIAVAGFLGMTVIMLRLNVQQTRSQSKNSPLKDLVDGVKFIGSNSVFSFLIGMSFFNSFFGLAYILMMPVFAVDVLKVESAALGFLMALNGVGALSSTMMLSARGNVRGKGRLIIGGGALYGLSVMAFALSAKFLSEAGSPAAYPVAAFFMFAAGVSNSLYMVPLMSCLQMLVPDVMRGRVMGFFGLTYNIMPLGGLFAGGLAGLVGAPFAVAAGAAGVAAFSLGPAMANRQVRDIDTLLEANEAARAKTPAPAPAPAAPGRAS